MNDKIDNTVDINSWLNRSFIVKDASYVDVVTNFKKMLDLNGFKIKKEIDIEASVHFEAVYGSRAISFLMSLIPLIGRNLSLGKRFKLKATITKGNPANISLSVVPYMELFNTSENLVLSQTMDEKVSDEYVAARKMYAITMGFGALYDIEPKAEMVTFENASFFRDTMLAVLIYPLDGYKSIKKLHLPVSQGPLWCWPAFVIPELWFMWHEIWGPSLLVAGIEFLAAMKAYQHGLDYKIVVFTFLTSHFFLGLLGNRIFYLRYGKWPKDKKERMPGKST